MSTSRPKPVTEILGRGFESSSELVVAKEKVDGITVVEPLLKEREFKTSYSGWGRYSFYDSSVGTELENKLLKEDYEERARRSRRNVNSLATRRVGRGCGFTFEHSCELPLRTPK